MAELAIAASVLGAATSAAGSLYKGMADKRQGQQQAAALHQSADYQSQLLQQQANAEQAAGQREAEQERLKAARVGSRATAVAAASGGGVTTPTIVDILDDIASQGELNASIKDYTGKERAAGRLDQAAAGQYNADVQGQAAINRGKASMVGSIFEGVAGLAKGAAQVGASGGFGGGDSTPDISGNPNDGWRLPRRRFG